MSNLISPMNVSVGIIPSVDGNICCIDGANRRLFAYDMPLLPDGEEIDRYHLQAIFRSVVHDHGSNVLCAIEIDDSHNFDQGVVIGIAEVLGFETMLVHSSKWRDYWRLVNPSEHRCSLRQTEAALLAAYAQQKAWSGRIGT